VDAVWGQLMPARATLPWLHGNGSPTSRIRTFSNWATIRSEPGFDGNNVTCTKLLSENRRAVNERQGAVPATNESRGTSARAR
jgi:hypothetical protein